MASMALAFDILARDRNASRTFDKVGDSAERAGKKGVGFGKAVKVGLGIASGAFAAVGLTQAIGSISNVLSDSIGEAREAQKVGATTAQIIKATGGAAKVSAKYVSDLAGALSEKVGVDDEAIQTGANLLLTFKNVRNEAGKGAAIFDRATAAAVDLSKAGFGSIDSASKMLGKALNDPIKGMAALGRAGVTFSEAQKKQIKTMTESGDILGAQKLILAEVESQVGGVAEATATTADKVKVSWANVKEQIGTALLPMLDRLGKWFLEKGLPAIQQFGNWVKDELWPALKDGWETVQPGLKKAQELLGSVFGEDSQGDMRSFSDFLTGTLIPGIATFVNVWLPIMASGWAAVATAARAAGAVFELQADIVRKVGDLIIGAFTRIMQTGADMLDVLSVVPGFGWAKDAADKMRNAADKANNLRDALNGIKSRSVTVSVNYVSKGTGRFDPAPTGYSPGRAGGGPVRRGSVYKVGDNPDGSWNKTTELFVPGQSGQILNQKQIAGVLSAVGAGGPSTVTEANDQRVMIQNLYANDLADIRRKAAQRAYQANVSAS